MSADLRARAATATLDLAFGFNPHQRRGPDGRFIKMSDHELKRPRRPRKRKATTENPLYRARREQYHEEVLGHVRANRAIFQDEDRYPELYAALDQAEAMPVGPERDATIDRMVELLNAHGSTTHPYTPPTTGGPEFTGAGRSATVRPSIDAPYAERAAALQASVDGGAVAEEMLAQGAMGETRRFELADGTSAVYKRHLRDFDRGWDRPVWTKKDQTDAEELSALTAAAIGVRAPAVSRTSEDEIYMELMPGQIGELRWPHRNTPPKGVVVGEQGVRMGLLDTLIANTDRHGGNYLVDEDENLYAIDHGMAFSRTHRIGESGQVERESTDRVPTTGDFALQNFVSPSGNYYDNPLTMSDVDHVRSQINGLRGEFESRGRADWWQSMSERLDRLALRANGDTPIY